VRLARQLRARTKFGIVDLRAASLHEATTFAKKITYFPLLPPPFTRHPLNQSARKTIIVHKYLSKYKNRARSKQKEKIINKGRAKFWPFHPLLFFFEFCFVFVFHFEITMAFGYGVLDASEMITTILLFILEYAN